MKRSEYREYRAHGRCPIDVQVPLGVPLKRGTLTTNWFAGFEEENLDCFNWVNWTSDPLVNSKKEKWLS